MPEILAVDIGNSRVKYGVFRDSILIKHSSAKTKKAALLDELRNEFSLEALIVSSVRDFDSKSFSELNIPRYKLDASLKEAHEDAGWINIPASSFTIGYKSGSPGTDRIAACAGARSLFSDPELLVVTCGTCITYNLLQDMTFRGGSISPGLHMRFEALNHFTGKLPLVNSNDEVHLVGKTTEEAIVSGVQIGICSEIDAVIAEYCKQYPNIKTVMTGGDASFLQKRLKSDIFAQNDLELYGLNYILKKHVQ